MCSLGEISPQKAEELSKRRSTSVLIVVPSRALSERASLRRIRGVRDAPETDFPDYSGIPTQANPSLREMLDLDLGADFPGSGDRIQRVSFLARGNCIR